MCDCEYAWITGDKSMDKIHAIGKTNIEIHFEQSVAKNACFVFGMCYGLVPQLIMQKDITLKLFPATAIETRVLTKALGPKDIRGRAGKSDVFTDYDNPPLKISQISDSITQMDRMLSENWLLEKLRFTLLSVSRYDLSHKRTFMKRSMEIEILRVMHIPDCI